MPDLGLDGLTHPANKHGQADADRNSITVAIEEADREIERLIDNHIVRSPHQIGLHLLGRGDEAVADDLGDDGVDPVLLLFAAHATSTSISRLPNRSTISRSPGATTVVDAYSCTKAGAVNSRTGGETVTIIDRRI